MDELDLLARRLLDRLEQAETRLLTWCVVEGGFTVEELEDHAHAVLDAAGSAVSPDELRDRILERRLLFEVRRDGRDLFRTRMAEAVRLLARLRQLFPGRPWQVAPPLAADFRFAHRPRRYPRRHLEPASVLDALRADAPGPAALVALHAMLGRGEGGLRLADFQLSATRRIWLDMRGRASRGVIVGAGTGTGKTLAFYLPALSYLAGLVERGDHWSKALAIYPRNELLKDQFSETYREARRLDDVLQGRRKFLLGAFFGPTPRNPGDVPSRREWHRAAGGFVCPWLRCPRCESDLVWSARDLEASLERLRCIDSRCDTVVTGDEVVLTREGMRGRPPDLLFTTTEMLNRQLGDSRTGHLFVGRPGRRPRLMLLDEAHTYTGTTGAQVALLLRRWHRVVNATVQFTGLSATLRDAAEFFGQLTGLAPGAVEEISPRPEELDVEPESWEYLLALRGDPVSGTSLLSTTIQAAMLLRRVLEPREEAPARGMYGRRVFVFTDDLDVTNRLYNNLQDAEALDSWDRPLPGRRPLAALRSVAEPDQEARDLAGQSWRMCEDVGHPYGLAVPLRLERTTSQDPGVAASADVVVATAALEVGFNDPEVGAVLQHKAPRDWAAFLQRKGRAGRQRLMRPWTVVVLSDYGRDRLTYQGYDQLFDPELPRSSLPVGNRYVLRIQAAFAFMDWLARQLPPGTPAGSVWLDLSGPPGAEKPWSPAVQRRQAAEADLVRRLVDGDAGLFASLSEYLRQALRLVEEEVRVLLWEPPRALMTAVLPTLLRRFETGWRRVRASPDEVGLDLAAIDHPLPDFVPRQLFGDLNLPEVEVRTDPQVQDDPPGSDFLPLAQALRTLAPGRVTRRFGYRHAYASHWMPLSNLSTPRQDLSVETYCAELEEVGLVQEKVGDEVRQRRCVRPWALHPTRPPGHLLPTSNSFLDWRSQFAPSSEVERLCFAPPRLLNWPALVADVRFFTHGQQTHVQVRRFAIGADASLRFKDGTESAVRVDFVEQSTGTPAAVGYEQEVDGIAFRLIVPNDLGLAVDHPNQAKVRACRAAYFRQRVQTDPALRSFANSFQLDWLAQIYLSALTARALAGQFDLPAAHAVLAGGAGQAMLEVLEVIFQSLATEEDEPVRLRVHERLRGLCETGEVTRRLGELARALWGPLDEGCRAWVGERYKATLGAALREACQQSCPKASAVDLLLDLDPGPRPTGTPALQPGYAEVWVTEPTGGGNGVVEEVLRVFVADPRRFFRLAEAALGPSDFELVDRELTRLLRWTQEDEEVRELLAGVRLAAGQGALAVAVEQMWAGLAARGLVVTHPVRAAVHARVLRPGSSPDTDGLLHRLAEHWRAEEERLGLEIDARVFAYLAGTPPDYQEVLSRVGLVPHQDPFWRFQVIFGLLWPRGYLVRDQALASYNPFAAHPPSDRELVLDLLLTAEPEVPLSAPDWREGVRDGLAETGTACLTAGLGDQGRLRQALLELMQVPLEIGFLHLYLHVEAVQHGPSGARVRLALREALQ
jgi:hypothetical protein